MNDECECPEGWCCGNPGCHRTLRMNDRLRRFGGSLSPVAEEYPTPFEMREPRPRQRPYDPSEVKK